MYNQEEIQMAVVEELLREESDGTISFGNHELAEKKKLEDFEYEKLLQDLTETTVNYIVSNPSLFKEKSKDMYEYEPVDIETLEPEYEYEIDISGEIEPYIGMGAIDSNDVDYFLTELANQYGGEIERRFQGYVVVGLNTDEYDEWESQFPQEVESWVSDLAEEYPDVDED